MQIIAEKGMEHSQPLAPPHKRVTGEKGGRREGRGSGGSDGTVKDQIRSHSAHGTG